LDEVEDVRNDFEDVLDAIEDALDDFEDVFDEVKNGLSVLRHVPVKNHNQ